MQSLANLRRSVACPSVDEQCMSKNLAPNCRISRKLASAQPRVLNVDTANRQGPTCHHSRCRPVCNSSSGESNTSSSIEMTEEERVKYAEKRVELRLADQVRQGRVRNVNGSEAFELMLDGWILLDVRPPTEAQLVPINSAVEVPIFTPDTAMNPGSLLKQLSAFGMGGWWLGGTHMIANTAFLEEVQSMVPRDARLVVGCQKGLRSLAACEVLSRAGYRDIAWVNGGFDATSKGDLPTYGVDLRLAGIGGLSSVVGWTEVQQEEARANKGKNTGFRLEGVFKLLGGFLAADLLLYIYLTAGGKVPWAS